MSYGLRVIVDSWRAGKLSLNRRYIDPTPKLARYNILLSPDVSSIGVHSLSQIGGKDPPLDTYFGQIRSVRHNDAAYPANYP